MEPKQVTTDAASLAADAQFVRSLARHLLRDAGGADDVSQQVILAALEKPPRGIAAERRGWLAQVTRHLVARRSRDASRRLGRERRAARTERVPSAVDVVQRFETRQRVAVAVRELPEPYRTVILLRFFDALPRRAITKRLGIAPATVTSRMQRGLELLRRRLDQEYGDRGSWCRALAPLVAGPSPWVFVQSVAEKGADRVVAVARSSWQGVSAMSASLKLALLASLLVAGILIVWQAGPSKEGGDGRPGPIQDVTRAAHVEPPAPDRTPLVPIAGGAEPDDFTGLGAETGGTVIVHVLLEDGSPVPGVGVYIEPLDLAEPHLGIREQITAADGTCHFEAVPEGAVTVFLNPQLDSLPPSQRGEVVAGEDLDITATIPEGVTVTGSVVDSSGTPVAGATIWASGRGLFGNSQGPYGGQALATASAGGTFTLHHMNPYQRLAAWAAGLAPSRSFVIKSVMEGKARPVEIELELPGAGGGFQGIVTDVTGAPIPGAVVVFGRVLADYQLGENGEWSLEAPPRRLATDETGVFHADGLAPGPQPVAVHAPGYGLWCEMVEIFAGTNVQVHPVLDEGATLSGRVTTEQGEPVTDCMISVQPDRLALDEERWKVAVDLIFYSASTDPAGEFTIAHLPAGRLVLGAQTDTNHVYCDVLTRSGETTRCDAVLAEGVSLRGRVTDDLGTPLVNWDIAAFYQDWKNDRGYLFPASTKSDDQGRFTCVNAKEGLYTLQFWEHAGSPVGLAIWVAKDIDSRAADHVFRIPRDAMPSARITGIILQPDGSPPPHGSWVVIKRADVEWGGASVSIDPGSGRFETGLLPPVRCKIEVGRDWVSTRHHLGEHDLAPGQTLDLGTVYLPE
ncbi:MAG: sigma-70 family RNA polymerase sigma factor [Planctomycetota bacterium]